MKVKIRNLSIIVIALLLLFGLGFPLAMISGDKQGKIVLNDKIILPFRVPKDKKVVLVYLGYVGCQTICTPSLEDSAKILNTLDDTSEVSFYFVNISKEEVGAQEFAKFFHREFIGLQLSKQETSDLMRELRAYSSDAIVQGGDIYHTGYLYLIKQEKGGAFTLKSMYDTRPFDTESIILDIKKELQ